MKLKKLSLLLPLLLFALVMASCSQSKSEVKALLKYAMEEANAECPVAVDDVTTMVNCRFDGSNVYYNYVIDEEESEFYLYEEESQTLLADIMKPLLEQSFVEDLGEDKEDVILLLENCIAADAELHYNYKGNISGGYSRIVFSPYELEALVAKMKE